MKKEQVVRALKAFEKRANGPTQYTPEWYGIRKEKPFGKPRIGGSEMATLLGLNPYETKEALLQFKETGEKGFISNLACKFGTLMEPISIRIFEIMNETEVTGRGICLVDRNINGVIFSPDGISYMAVDEGLNILPFDHESSLFMPVLLEIKCPFRRIPSPIMPSYYVPQIQTGLICMEIASHAVFVDNLIRVCSYGDLVHGGYNKRIHRDREEIGEPSYMGIVLVLLSPDAKAFRTTPHTYANVLDLGDVAERAFETNIALAGDERNLIYMEPREERDELIEDLDAWLDTHTHRPLGMICWKFYGAIYSVRGRDPSLIESIYDSVNDYLGLEQSIEPSAVSPVMPPIAQHVPPQWGYQQKTVVCSFGVDSDGET